MSPGREQALEGAALATLAFIAKVCVLKRLGPVLSPDSYVYLSLAKAIAGLDSADTTLAHASYRSLYLGYPLFLVPFVATGRAFETKLEIVALSQAALSAVSIAWFYSTLRLVVRRPALGMTLWFALSPESLLWDRVISSDSMNLSLLVLATAAVLRQLIADRGIGLGVIPLALLCVARPTNVVFLAITAVALARHTPRPWGPRLVAAGIVATMLMLVFGARLSGESLVAIFARRAAAGIVINDRPAYDVTLPNGINASPAGALLTSALVVAKRGALFWAPALSGFSARHAAMSWLWWFPLWSCLVWQVARMARSGFAPAEAYLVALVVGYNTLHALTMIDFDLRYRLSVLPFVCLLASRGLEGLAASRSSSKPERGRP